MITWENYEEYIMMHADGELNPAEEKALMQFIAQHPELKKELAAYDLTRLSPDTTQVFTNKEALLKPVPAKRMIAFPKWTKYSIAAGVAAIIFISLFRYMTRDVDVVEVAKTDGVKTQENKIIAPVVAANNMVKEPAVKEEINQDTAIVKHTVHSEVKIAAVPAVHKEARKQNEVKYERPAMQDVATIDELPLAEPKQMPSVNTGSKTREVVTDVPVYAVQNDAEETKKTFWDRLPIDDMKKDQMKNISGAVADVYKDVNAAKEDLYKRSISIKIEKRKLFISF